MDLATFCTIIFILFFLIAVGCSWHFFFKPLQSVETKLQAVSNSLKNYNNNNIMYSYETLDTQLQKNFLVKEAWEKYKKNLARSKDDEVIRIYSTVEASDYFNVPAFSGSLSVSFFSGMAGIFTGLGILGTFVGLTIGLFGIDTTSTTALQNSISDLIGGMKTAFLTSIFGVALGIGFNIFYSRAMKKFAAVVQEIEEHFERIFARRTIEEILMEQSTEAQEQTAILNRLGTDMASALCDRLPDVLEGIADKLNESLKGDLRELFDSLREELQKLNGGAISAVADSFNNGAGKQIAGFAQTLEKLSEGMEAILRKSQEANQDMNTQIQESLRQLLQKVQTSMSDSLDKQKNGFEENITQNQLLMQEMRESMQRMAETMEDLSNKSRSSMVEAAQGIAENARLQSEEAQKSAQAMRQSTEETLASLSERIGEMQRAMEKHENSLRQILLSMEKTMTSSKDLIQNAGATADVFRQAAGPVQNVVNTMNGNITQLVKTNEEYGRRINANVELMADAADLNQATLKEIQDVLEKTKSAWTAYETHFGNVKQELVNTFEVLDQGLKQYNEITDRSLNVKLQRFDETIGSAVGRLTSITEESSESVDALANAISELRKSMNYNRR